MIMAEKPDSYEAFMEDLRSLVSRTVLREGCRDGNGI